MRISVRRLIVVAGALALGAASVGTIGWAKKRITPKPTIVVNPNPVVTNSKDGLKYVWVQAGNFLMGCSPGDDECVDDEKPAHQVAITKGFWIGQTPVTVAAYQRYTQATGKPMPVEPAFLGRPVNPGWKDEGQPIADVNWYESRDYCVWEGGRLPTDAEWEYAARGGNPKARYGALDDIAWYADNSGPQRLDSTALKNEDKAKFGGGRKIFNQALHDNGNSAHDVGLKAPNGYGLYDMLGNVWEWMNDWYEPHYYDHSPPQDPQGPSAGTQKLERSASWDDVPQYIRVSYNHKARPELREWSLGFRCVWDRAKGQ